VLSGACRQGLKPLATGKDKSTKGTENRLVGLSTFSVLGFLAAKWLKPLGGANRQ
jgi:hypothetical protein